MTPLTAQAALPLSPEQAADLTRVLDLQAAWENHRGDPAGDAHGPGLRERQRRYDAFPAAQAGHAARHRPVDLPEAGSLGSPERLAGWCRAVGAACRRAGPDAEAPAQAVEKAYRLAGRIAARLKVAPPDRDGRSEGMDGAVAGLDAVVAWCDGPGSGRATRAEAAPLSPGLSYTPSAHHADPAASGRRAA